MKKNSLFSFLKTGIVIYATLGLLFSCKTRIEIKEKLIDVDCTPSTQKINFECSSAWTIKLSDKEWSCENKPVGDAGKHSVSIYFGQNYDTLPKKGYIFIESGNNKDTIVVTQKGNDKVLILISSEDLSIKPVGSQETLSFCALRDWTIVPTVKWISVEKQKGNYGVQNILVSIEQNLSYEGRTGKVIIKTGGIQKSVQITQDGKAYRNRGWNFYDYNARNIPTCMASGSYKYVFDFDNKKIIYYENNRRLKEFIYETKLEDPREWNMESIGLVKEYEYSVQGVLYKAIYTYGSNSKYYAEVDISDTGKEKTSTWEIHEKNTGVFDDIILDIKTFLWGYEIYCVDKSTGIKKYIETLNGEDVKHAVLYRLKTITTQSN